jgi:Putative prokaryotic signal transducing protein
LNEAVTHDWVSVDGFTDAIHADIVRGRLEAEGIPALLANRHLVTADWTVSQALGGVRIMVPPEHVLAAREIIAQIDAGEFLDTDEEFSQDDVCETCNTLLVRKTSSTWKLALFSIHLLLPLPLPFRKHYFYCPQCGT